MEILLGKSVSKEKLFWLGQQEVSGIQFLACVMNMVHKATVKNYTGYITTWI